MSLRAGLTHVVGIYPVRKTPPKDRVRNRNRPGKDRRYSFHASALNGSALSSDRASRQCG
jgi:hypothetical protein